MRDRRAVHPPRKDSSANRLRGTCCVGDTQCMTNNDITAVLTARRPTIRHSRGISLASRGAGAHLYRNEIESDGGKAALRRKARRVGKQAFRRALASDLY